MKDKKANKKQVQEMKEHLAEGKEWLINPKRIGNLARTCCHSCEPNLSSLTNDYGAKYIEEHLKNDCFCERASCKSSLSYKMMDETNEKSLEMYQTLRYHYRCNVFYGKNPISGFFIFA
ncbi:hypothetical protein B9Z55_028208 [Caenorhabditis nigoni]|uniref:Uncharacterized protein n=1 Tax=Caenorhabditis nigoni TaxID=1611254 RepID=A0A2G5SCR0_9PELO|nr:hypothetical protein B9Z55_028208 [Caenorhabditis nigoni]